MGESHERNRRAPETNPEHSGMRTGNPQLSDDAPRNGRVRSHAKKKDKGDRPGTASHQPAHDGRRDS